MTISDSVGFEEFERPVGVLLRQKGDAVRLQARQRNACTGRKRGHVL